jgi:hypothetical protein
LIAIFLRFGRRNAASKGHHRKSGPLYSDDEFVTAVRRYLAERLDSDTGEIGTTDLSDHNSTQQQMACKVFFDDDANRKK